MDENILEGMRYDYRLTATKGSEASTSVLVEDLGVKILGIAHLAVTSETGAVKFQWENRSVVGTGIQILRENFIGLEPILVIATLPPTATSFTDTVGGQIYHGYNIRVTQGIYASAPTKTVAAPLVLDNPSLTQSALLGFDDWVSPKPIPGNDWTYLVHGNPLLQIQKSMLSPGALHPLDSPRQLYGFYADRNGNPHTIYSQSSESSSALLHEWYGEGTWRKEYIPTSSINSQISTFPGLIYAPTSEGHPLCLWATGSTYPLNEFTFGWWDGSRWMAEPFPAGLASRYGNVAMFADRENLPHVLAGTLNQLYHFHRTPDGIWHSETIPASGYYEGHATLVGGVGEDSENLWVAYTTQLDTGYRLQVIRKASGAWQPAVDLDDRPHDGMNTQASIAMSPDRSRIALQWKNNYLPTYFIHSQSGWVKGHVAGTSAYGYSPVFLGFRPDGRLTLVESISWPGAEIQSYAFMSEP